MKFVLFSRESDSTLLWMDLLGGEISIGKDLLRQTNL